MALKLGGHVTVAAEGCAGTLTGSPVRCKAYTDALEKALACVVTATAIRPHLDPVMTIIPTTDEAEKRLQEMHEPDFEELQKNWHPPLFTPSKLSVEVGPLRISPPIAKA